MGTKKKSFLRLSFLMMVMGIFLMVGTIRSKAEYYDDSITQIGQTFDSVTVQLYPQVAAKMEDVTYGICEITKTTKASQAAENAHAQAYKERKYPCKLSGNKFTFTGLKPSTSYYVCFGYKRKGYHNFYDFTFNGMITTLPDKPTGFGAKSVSDSGVTMQVDFKSGIEEYRYQILDIKGKEIKHSIVGNWMLPSNSFTRYHEYPGIYKVIFTPVAEINGKDYFGESAETYVVDQPQLSYGPSDIKRLVTYKKGKITFSFDKIAGASSYDVYLSTDKSSGYEKVATVGGKKKSTVTIKKFGGKKLKKNGAYYLKIVTNYKKDGVTYRSLDSYCYLIKKKAAQRYYGG